MKGLYISSIVAILHLFIAVKSQDEIDLCSQQQTEAMATGTVRKQGSDDKCLCTATVEGEPQGSFVNIRLMPNLINIGQNDKTVECFPRLGIRAPDSGNVKAFHVCPSDEAMDLMSTVQISGSESLIIGIDNNYNAEYEATVRFMSDQNLTFVCGPSDKAIMSGQLPWGGLTPGGGDGKSTDPNGQEDGQATAVALGVTIPIILLAVIGVIVICMLRARKAKAAKEKDPNELEEGDRNPGFEKDSLHSAPGAKSVPIQNDKQPVHAAPPQYGNVNLDPMPNNGPGMTKQSSVGNLSQVSSVSSAGAPDLGAGVLHTAGIPDRDIPAQLQAPVPMQAAPAPMRAPIVQAEPAFAQPAEPAPMPMHAMQAQPAPMPYVRNAGNHDAVHTEI